MSKRKTARRKDPREFADQYVDQWFGSLQGGHECLIRDSGALVDFDPAFDELVDVLDREEFEQLGKPYPNPDEEGYDEDRLLRRERCATSAGYMIGIRIGMRLRGDR